MQAIKAVFVKSLLVVVMEESEVIPSNPLAAAEVAEHPTREVIQVLVLS
jgi:hypothetical protein